MWRFAGLHWGFAGSDWGEIRCQLGGNPVSVHHSWEIRGGKSGVSSSFLGNPGGKSGVSSSFLGNPGGEIRCQFIILVGNPVSVHHSWGEIRCQDRGKSGVSSSFLGNPVSEIRCQFIILAGGKSGVSSSFLRGGNPVSVHHSAGGNPVSGGNPGGNPVSVHHSCPGKSGVSSSFLPEKMNRHRITRSLR